MWRFADEAYRVAGFALIDFTLAGAFLVMARGKWFPVPLFILHAALMVHHLFAAANEAPIAWIGAFLNRAFEAALLYVAACALWRIRRIRERRKGAPRRGAPSTEG